MRLIQISDPHLPRTPGECVDGVDTHERLTRLVDHLAGRTADLLVVTGDIAYLDGTTYCYEHFTQTMRTLPYPWIVLPGNHDRGPLFRERLAGHAPTHFEVRATSAPFPVICFDTSEEMPSRHLAALAAYLAGLTRPHLFFTHYPPVRVGHPSFDGKHRLAWREELLDVLQRSPVPLHIFFGHLHFAFEQRQGHLHLYGVPSATVPTMPGIGADLPDHQHTYYREIHVGPAGCETDIVRVPFARA